MVCDHHVCCIPLVCALMYCPSSGEVRGLGVDHSGHLVSLPSCALSLSYKHCSGESVALLLLHLHIPDQPVVTLLTGKNVVTWNTFQTNPLSSLPAGPLGGLD